MLTVLWYGLGVVIFLAGFGACAVWHAARTVVGIACHAHSHGLPCTAECFVAVPMPQVTLHVAGEVDNERFTRRFRIGRDRKK